MHKDLTVVLKDRPGVLGNIAGKLASGGVNIQLSYSATSTRLVLGVDDLTKAQAALASETWFQHTCLRPSHIHITTCPVGKSAYDLIQYQRR
jgi:hypothetical protein